MSSAGSYSSSLVTDRHKTRIMTSAKHYRGVHAPDTSMSADRSDGNGARPDQRRLIISDIHGMSMPIPTTVACEPNKKRDDVSIRQGGCLSGNAMAVSIRGPFGQQNHTASPHRACAPSRCTCQTAVSLSICCRTVPKDGADQTRLAVQRIRTYHSNSPKEPATLNVR